ncbi:hypothetical protein GSI_05049 [Ganoderma sinense ZZ0214-1]|uniref:Uncharacterized protein n=1 Tax=Ganoderma sinense ZZ0214-1 TaxID=1077348 RepID=A0A2G8SGQ4_9APHY|nr:hypothetical protein GSI_05049 [Ganoderma sinense ZZ0214-1]
MDFGPVMEGKARCQEDCKRSDDSFVGLVVRAHRDTMVKRQRTWQDVSMLSFAIGLTGVTMGGRISILPVGWFSGCEDGRAMALVESGTGTRNVELP